MLRGEPHTCAGSRAPVEEFPDDQEHIDELEFYNRELSVSNMFAFGWRFVRLLPACIGFGSEFIYGNLMTSAGLHFASLAK